MGYVKSLLKCVLQIVSKNFLNYINSFLTVLCCSSVSSVCLLSLLHFFGCVGARRFCCFVGVGVVTSGLHSELLDGVVYLGEDGKNIYEI